MSEINHPSHYNEIQIECIEVAKHFDFTIGNAIKYLWRAGKKGNIVQDLAKAQWYIRYHIKNLREGTHRPRATFSIADHDGKILAIEDVRQIILTHLPLGSAICEIMAIHPLTDYNVKEKMLKNVLQIIDSFMRSAALDSALDTLQRKAPKYEHVNVYLETREKVMCRDCGENLSA